MILKKNNSLNCIICNKSFDSYRGLSMHIIRSHNLTPQQYFDKYIEKNNTCPNCGKETNWHNLANGYYKFCSIQCVSKYKGTKIKRNKTKFKKYGDKKYNNRAKCIETMNNMSYEDKRRWGDKISKKIKKIPDKTKNQFTLYKNKVHRITRFYANKKFNKEQLSKIGLCGIDNAYQFDHMYSIKEGFENNIEPEIIGHYCNIQILPWEVNNKKRCNSCITLNTLLKRINSYDEI